MMLRNVSERLRPGGFFIGTIPNAFEIVYDNSYIFELFIMHVVLESNIFNNDLNQLHYFNSSFCTYYFFSEPGKKLYKRIDLEIQYLVYLSNLAWLTVIHCLVLSIIFTLKVLLIVQNIWFIFQLLKGNIVELIITLSKKWCYMMYLPLQCQYFD